MLFLDPARIVFSSTPGSGRSMALLTSCLCAPPPYAAPQAVDWAPTMDYHTGRLTISSDDVAALAALALQALWRQLRMRRQQSRSPHQHSAPPRSEASAQELAIAHQLLKQQQYRAAGAVAGVALELHLKHVARTQGLSVQPYATIAQVQDRLRYAGLLTNPQRKLLKKLGAIRNQCVHARPEPPSRAAVERLIQGVEQLMGEAGKEHGHD